MLYCGGTGQTTAAGTGPTAAVAAAAVAVVAAAVVAVAAGSTPGACGAFGSTADWYEPSSGGGVEG